MPYTLPIVIAEVIIIVMMVEVDLGHNRPDTPTFEIVEFIILVLMVEVELVLNIPTTYPLTITEQDLVLKGEVYIGLRPVNCPRSSKEVVVYFWVSNLFIVL